MRAVLSSLLAAISIFVSAPAAAAEQPQQPDAEFRPGTAYWLPVVYITYDRNETLRLHALAPYSAALIPFICARLKVKPAVRACNVLVGSQYIYLVAQIEAAAERPRGCFKVRMPANAAVTTAWLFKAYSVRCQ